MEALLILILATVTLSAVVGVFSGIITLFKGKSLEQSFYLFLYSLFGGLLGGIIGSIIGAIIGSFVAMLIPSSGSIIIIGEDLEKVIAFTIVMIICWLLCTISGAIMGNIIYSQESIM